jgi:hypothetical protein
VTVDLTHTELEDVGRQHKIKTVLRQAKELALEYYRLTNKPLGITGEVAEFEAAEKLGLSLADARTPLFDASREVDGKKEFFQIKGRAVLREDPYRGRVPAINCNGSFDAVLLVLLDKASLDVIEIRRAERRDVADKLAIPGGKARNERRSVGLSQFKSISKKIWPPP